MTLRRLWIGGYGPEQSAHGRGLAAFRRHVETSTGGEVTVDITWNIMDEGRRNTELFDLVEEGRMFLCYFSSSYLGGRVPELDVLEIPFLFDDLDRAHRALDGALGDRLKQAVREATPFEALGFWDNGFRHLTNRLRPVHTPDDVAGMSVRMQPNALHEDLIRSWGATPVAVDLNRAIELISSGQVDAQDNPLANTVAYGVDKVHRHVTMSGHLYGARGLFAGGAAYQALATELRRVVDDAVVRAVAEQRRAAAALEETLRARLEADGVEFVDLDPVQREAFVAASAPTIDRARSRVGPELYDLARG